MFNALKYLPLVLLLASSAEAQTAQSQQPVDPRLAQPMLEAVQGVLRLREAELRVTVQDYETRLETAMQWLKTAQDEATKPTR